MTSGQETQWSVLLHPHGANFPGSYEYCLLKGTVRQYRYW